jgi:hypothetical protein
MLIEDELAGDWVYQDCCQGLLKAPGKHQAKKRSSALQALYKNYQNVKKNEIKKQEQN